MRTLALQGELETSLLSLSDDEYTRASPDEGDWSAQQIVEHVAAVAHRYREEILQAAEQGRAQAAALGQGLIEHYGVPPEKARFFTVHVEADEDHGTLARDIALAYLTTPALQELTRTTTLRRLELLYDVWTISN